MGAQRPLVPPLFCCAASVGTIFYLHMSTRIFSTLLLVCGVTIAFPLAAAENEGWVPLFDGKSNQGWHSFRKKTFPESGWKVEDGWFHCLGKNGGDLISDGEYDNFELRWEWKQAPAGNSGLKYFITEQRTSAIGHEYQMIDDEREPDAKLADGKRVTAAFYDVLKPTKTPPTKPAGEINQSRILVRGNHVEHWLNGAKVLEYECGSDQLKAAVANSKFKNVADFGDKIKGHILLQDHHSQVWFRKIEIRQLK